MFDEYAVEIFKNRSKFKNCASSYRSESFEQVVNFC